MQDQQAIGGPIASIIIPAHDEARSISRLLSGLLDLDRPGEFEVIVVCNGCSDDTANVASRFGSDIHVIELAQPSKAAALRHGDTAASYYPRIYLDADIEIAAADIRQLVSALDADGIHAAGPARVVPKDTTSPLVRAYYEVWERLPQVRSGLFGRGVIALSHSGHQRVNSLPESISDDLAISEAFRSDERVVVCTATAIVRPPRTTRDLLRRRIRVHTGNAQFDQTTGRRAESKTDPAVLLAIVREGPRPAISMLAFLGIGVTARLAARRWVRRGDYTTWLRDESSRLG